MKFKIGIDVGGTFTDFLLTGEDGSTEIYKVLSTPDDPSIATMRGINEMAGSRNISIKDFLRDVTTIVHGTTVTTNAVLTYTGVKTGLLTTEGTRDALEMRRGIREEQYNNRYPNARPVVERYLRLPVSERLDYRGEVLTSLDQDDLKEKIEYLKKEKVEALAICFMNSFANDCHEQAAAVMARELLPDCYITVSAELLPSIRFYDRISTTALNSYIGPILKRYLEALIAKLKKEDFQGILLIMASNGGVVSPPQAMEKAALTLLSGPAGGPVAGVFYAGVQKYDDCITVDMGGTSFDAAVIKNKKPSTTTVGEINRLRTALPMLNVVTIGAGGGSIGWIDEGGLLRMGPQSAGSKPGPVCYGLGGTEPTCTDADLLLGYLEPGFFAGGRINLEKDKAERAILEKIAQPLGYDVIEAAAGMYNIINVNMAAAVREVAVKEGADPRDFPMVVAGGAGPNHSCMIARELEIPSMIIPRESSIFCAAGMLMSDLQHDLVKSYITRLDQADPTLWRRYFQEMTDSGRQLLAAEGIPEEKIRFIYSLDLRYLRQYHEVNVEISENDFENGDWNAISAKFHPVHNRLYGYSLEEEHTPVELINLRLIAIGVTEKPAFNSVPFAGESPEKAFKKQREVYLPSERNFRPLNVYDALKLEYGNRVQGPAILEQVNTTAFITPEYDVVVDRYGSYCVYARELENEIVKRIMST
ncbi:MAG: hydantoinase/oxoprolinase family protein [Pseudomonadota bacterium]|nr:hydantoinase/oxoprolinase family protein [Pseudomonadota bacterium]